jgi:hypothetical protein
MSDEPRTAAHLQVGDISVSPDNDGFTVGLVDESRKTWVPISMGMAWAAAIRRAYAYSLLRHGRILTSRTGRTFELLDPQSVWLGTKWDWRPHEPMSIAQHAPETPGIYVLRALTPIYIGETDNLRERLLYHFHHAGACEEQQGALEFCCQEYASADERARETARLIDWWWPPCNHTA